MKTTRSAGLWMKSYQRNMLPIYFNVSLPCLIKLLEEKEIPFRTVGAWRRVRLADLLAYKHNREEQSKAALQELMDQAQELDLGY
jgi:excisionase family DNA binding protein